jgi:hypothetical protein
MRIAFQYLQLQLPWRDVLETRERGRKQAQWMNDEVAGKSKYSVIEQHHHVWIDDVVCWHNVHFKMKTRRGKRGKNTQTHMFGHTQSSQYHPQLLDGDIRVIISVKQFENLFPITLRCLWTHKDVRFRKKTTLESTMKAADNRFHQSDIWYSQNNVDLSHTIVSQGMYSARVCYLRQIKKQQRFLHSFSSNCIENEIQWLLKLTKANESWWLAERVWSDMAFDCFSNNIQLSSNRTSSSFSPVKMAISGMWSMTTQCFLVVCVCVCMSVFFFCSECDRKKLHLRFHLSHRDYAQTRAIFDKYKPTHVIHLAAIVGGLFKNMRENLRMYRENVMINDNVMRCCSECKVSWEMDDTLIHWR